MSRTFLRLFKTRFCGTDFITLISLCQYMRAKNHREFRNQVFPYLGHLLGLGQCGWVCETLINCALQLRSAPISAKLKCKSDACASCECTSDIISLIYILSRFCWVCKVFDKICEGF